MEKHHYDIAIIGGGPAGSTAALTAASFGYKTIILDREKFPRDKICGDALIDDSIHLLHSLGLNKDKLNQLQSKFEVPNFFFENKDAETWTISNHGVFQCKRNELDYFLWSEIPKTIEKQEGIHHLEIQYDFNSEKYKIKFNLNNDTITAFADFLIGADGYSSVVKRTFFKSLKISQRVACRYYLKNVNVPIEVISNLSRESIGFYFYPEIHPGYFWIFPLNKNEFNTGVYLPYHTEINIKTIFKELLQKHISIEFQEEEFHTWAIPNNTQFDCLVSNNCLLTGDAAGLCDYLIGHGIDAAILSGYLSVKSIHYFKNNNKNNFPISEIYRYNLEQYLGKSLRLSEMLYDSLRANELDLKTAINQYLNNEND